MRRPTSTELKSWLDLRSASAEQVGRVLSKLAKEDGRIARKTANSKRTYLLPVQ